MTLNTHANTADPGGARSRQEVVENLLEEMTPWNPQERMSAFRSFLSGSLSLIHLHVLTILEVQGPLSMTRLAEEIDVSVASATGIVDRMEQRHLVKRQHGDTDRRVVLVHATKLGGEVFARLRRHRRAKLKKVLAQLSDIELTAFLTGLRAIRRARASLDSTTKSEPAS